MCLNIRCDEKSEKFYKIFYELNMTLVCSIAYLRRYTEAVFSYFKIPKIL
jgi:hypothetical protein